jgi:glutamate racemase
MANNYPIGLFDSGIGGISIYNEIKKSLPTESTIYIADNLNAPYGKKKLKLR